MTISEGPTSDIEVTKDTCTHKAGTPTQRDEELWFEDGNIILASQDTEFRVYKGPLMKHSPVFRDMLSLPQPECVCTGSTGPVVIRISDSSQDLRHFLRALVAGNALL